MTILVSSRFKKFRKGLKNWLNGLPIKGEEYFDAESNLSTMEARKKNKKRKKKKSSLMKRRNSSQLSKLSKDNNNNLNNMTNTTINNKAEDDEEERARRPVRIIQIPPDPLIHNHVNSRHHRSRGKNRDDDLFSALVSNHISTAKYSLWTFLPKNLFEQFRRVANFYFLIIVILQAIPALSNYNVFLASIPLIIIVGATAIKDAVEDWRRKKQDHKVNYNQTKILQRPNLETFFLNTPSRFIFTSWLSKLFNKVKGKGDFSLNSNSTPISNSTPNLNSDSNSHQSRANGMRNSKSTYSQLQSQSFRPSHLQSYSHSQVHLQPLASECHSSPSINHSSLIGSSEEAIKIMSIDDWQTIFWKDIRVGDIIYLKNNEMIPADILILATSEPEQTCYVETKNLDGETNLKIRSGLTETSWIHSANDASRLQAIIETELPTSNLYSVRGKIIINQNVIPIDSQDTLYGKQKEEQEEINESNENASKRENSKIKKEVNKWEFNENTKSREQHGNDYESLQDQFYEPVIIPFGVNNVLYRGCIVRNTDYVIGITIYTGPHTKLMLNSGYTPSKRSRIERQMNPQIILNFGLLFIICLVCAVVQGNVSKSMSEAPFWTRAFDQSVYSSSTFVAFLTFWSSIILFQTLVPISLYITVELCKTIQAYFIHADIKIYHELSDTRCTPRTWNLSDDLGQIEYLFSDKTGTLTRNVMEFRKCTINGRAYGLICDKRDYPLASPSSISLDSISQPNSSNSPISPFPSNSPFPFDNENSNSFTNDLAGRIMAMEKSGKISENQWLECEQKMILEIQKIVPYRVIPPISSSFVDPELFIHLQKRPEISFKIIQFFTILSLCHTVLVEKKKKTLSPLSPSSQSHCHDPSSPINHQKHENGNKNKDGNGNKNRNKLKTENRNDSDNVNTHMDNIKNQRIDNEISDNHENFNNNNFENELEIMAELELPHNLIYKAQSPDEAALVSSARDLGFVFLGRELDIMKISILGQIEEIKLLNVLEFNSSRKRMSVIIRKANGTIMLLCKGADNVIYDRLSFDQQHGEHAAMTQIHLEMFAEEGLRTLCLAQKYLSDQEYLLWAGRYAEACASIQENRENLIDQLADEIENGMQLIGATAIEDRLQDGVPECIEVLQKAGIKIWILTGDKLETAINIGFSCKLLKKDMLLLVIKGLVLPCNTRNENENNEINEIKNNNEINQMKMENSIENENIANSTTFNENNVNDPLVSITIDNGKSKESPELESTKRQLQEAYNRVINDKKSGMEPSGNGDGNAIGERNKFALILEGSALKYAFDPSCRRLFVELASVCQSVICCRVSPLQKAKVVELIKRGKHAMTLAIGDGANDVSMLQAADIGVGIAGQEGMQAVMSSDYAIAQFRYLQRLLLVHGRWSYIRTASATIGSLYKNILFVVLLFWYQFYCGFTAQFVYDYMFLMFFNMLFSTLPIFAIGIFDRDLDDTYLESIAPIYNRGIRQTSYSMIIFLWYTVDAFYQSLVCFFIPLWSMADIGIGMHGLTEDKTLLGNVMAISIIMTGNLFIAFTMTRSLLFFMWLSLGLTILVLLGFFLAYSLVPGNELYGSYSQLNEPVFWFTILLAIVVALTPRIILKYLQVIFRPNDVDIVREIAKFQIHTNVFTTATATANSTIPFDNFDPINTLNTPTIAINNNINNMNMNNNVNNINSNFNSNLNTEMNVNIVNSNFNSKSNFNIERKGGKAREFEEIKNSKGNSNLNGNYNYNDYGSNLNGNYNYNDYGSNLNGNRSLPFDPQSSSSFSMSLPSLAINDRKMIKKGNSKIITNSSSFSFSRLMAGRGYNDDGDENGKSREIMSMGIGNGMEKGDSHSFDEEFSKRAAILDHSNWNGEKTQFGMGMGIKGISSPIRRSNSQPELSSSKLAIRLCRNNSAIAILNLQTGHYEQLHGFAFSQEEGMKRLVLPPPPSSLAISSQGLIIGKKFTIRNHNHHGHVDQNYIYNHRHDHSHNRNHSHSHSHKHSKNIERNKKKQKRGKMIKRDRNGGIIRHSSNQSTNHENNSHKTPSNESNENGNDSENINKSETNITMINDSDYRLPRNWNLFPSTKSMFINSRRK